MRDFGESYLRGLGTTARNNGLAFGYSVTATASFGVLARTDGPASVGRIFLFVLGSGVAFGVVAGLVTRGFRQRVEREPPVVLALATAFALSSTSAGVGAAALVGTAVGGWGAWLVGSLLPTWVYLAVSALEIAISRALHITVGETDPAER